MVTSTSLHADKSYSYTTFFDTRSLDRIRESPYGSMSSTRSSTPVTPVTPTSYERGKNTFNPVNSERSTVESQVPETGNFRTRSQTLSRQSTYSTCTSTRPATPIVSAEKPMSKRSTLPSSFKLAAIVEPKIQRRQTTLRNAGAVICEERSEVHEEGW